MKLIRRLAQNLNSKWYTYTYVVYKLFCWIDVLAPVTRVHVDLVSFLHLLEIHLILIIFAKHI